MSNAVLDRSLTPLLLTTASSWGMHVFTQFGVNCPSLSVAFGSVALGTATALFSTDAVRRFQEIGHLRSSAATITFMLSSAALGAVTGYGMFTP